MMGPLSLSVYARAEPWLRDMLVRAQHFNVSQETMKPISDICDAIAKATDEGPHFFEWTLPSSLTVVEIDNLPAAFVVEQHPHNENTVLLYVLHEKGISHVATTYRYTDTINHHTTAFMANYKIDFDLTMGLAVQLDVLFAAIAEPRLVQKLAPSRPFRRSAKRMLGAASPVAWYTLAWTVGRAVHAKIGNGDENHGVALHVVRAHWRFLDRQTKATIYRKGSRGKGWYLWIRHHFKGHPDFGVKLHRLQPKFGPDSAAALRVVKANATLAARDRMISDWSKQKES